MFNITKVQPFVHWVTFLFSNTAAGIEKGVKRLEKMEGNSCNDVVHS